MKGLVHVVALCIATIIFIYMISSYNKSNMDEPIYPATGVQWAPDVSVAMPLPPYVHDAAFNDTVFVARNEQSSDSSNGPLTMPLGKPVPTKDIPDHIYAYHPNSEITGGLYAFKPRYEYTGNMQLTEYNTGDPGGLHFPTLGADDTAYSFTSKNQNMWHDFDNVASGYSGDRYKQDVTIDPGDVLRSYGPTTNVKQMGSMPFVPDHDEKLGIEENYTVNMPESVEFIRYMREASHIAM